MSGSLVGRRYARALFDLVQESGAERIRKDLSRLVETWNNSKELRDLFENPSVGAESRAAVLKVVAARLSLHPMLLNTVQLLSDRRRLRYVPELADAFNQLAEQKTGRIRAEVTTATRMPESYFERLQRTLEQSLGKKIVVVPKEDPALIGGVITRVGDKVFDGSIRTQLQELQTTLLSQESV